MVFQRFRVMATDVHKCRARNRVRKESSDRHTHLPADPYTDFPWWEQRRHELVEHLPDNPAHSGLVEMIAQDLADYLELTPDQRLTFLTLAEEWNGTWEELYICVLKL